MQKTSAKIKRPLWVACLNIALALTVGTTQAFADTPITNQTELQAIGANVDSRGGNYVVTESFEVVDPFAEGNTYVTGTFTGTFDGGGFTISGLTKPLFEVIDGDESSPVATHISDLTLEAATDGVSGEGILAIEAWSGTVIDDVHVTGDVNGESNVGGLVGYSEGAITNSSATGNVSGIDNVGGLAGLSDGTISNSYATGTVDGTGDYVGGLVGYSSGDIQFSYSTGVVEGDNYVGGLVGLSEGAISNSSATGAVGGTNGVGGLVGESTGTIDNSYATGNVTGSGDAVGGLVGYSEGAITNSYATGDVEGTNYVGGLVSFGLAAITNSYAAGNVTGDRVVGGLVATALGNISNSYASGNVEADDISDSSEFFGGLVAEAYYPITNSYASGNVTAVGSYIDGLVGFEWGDIVFDSYTSGNVNDTPCVEPCSPLTATELLAILNTGAASPVFALGPSINAGRPYLISNAPPGNDGGNDEVVEVSIRIDFSSLLPTQALSALSKSVGFEAAKSDLNKLDLAFLDEVKGEKSAPITGAKLFANQSLTTSLSVGSLLQLEINFEANKSLQMWVKSSDDQYVLVGDITFDKDGNAVLPGIEFKKGGSYEFTFVNSDKKDLTQPELVNKVSGLTVYVNE